MRTLQPPQALPAFTLAISNGSWTPNPVGVSALFYPLSCRGTVVMLCEAGPRGHWVELLSWIRAMSQIKQLHHYISCLLALWFKRICSVSNSSLHLCNGSAGWQKYLGLSKGKIEFCCLFPSMTQVKAHLEGAKCVPHCLFKGLWWTQKTAVSYSNSGHYGLTLFLKPHQA